MRLLKTVWRWLQDTFVIGVEGEILKADVRVSIYLLDWAMGYKKIDNGILVEFGPLDVKISWWR